LPKGVPIKFPKIQHAFDTPESESDKKERLERQKTIRGAMEHSWDGYRTYAWGHDEIIPVRKSYRDPFCGWAATLVVCVVYI